MKKIKTSRIIIFLILNIFISGCVEPIDIDESLKFENAIVIEATITNEYKYQEIFLSNSFSFNDNISVAETNASVKIVDETQNTYVFHESSPGKYISVNEFSAQLNKDYQLLITTSDGKSYSSQFAQLPNITQIDNLYASREVDNLGNEGVSIFVDSYDPTGNSNYYRYEYEETYKIIAPNWNLFDLVVTSNSPPYTTELQVKTQEEQVCYNSVNSNIIIQTETNDLSEDRVANFKVRTISKNNPIISHRYSILVKQYVQSLEAYSYYNTLNKISSTTNLLSSNQPGFISGNIFSVENSNELVIGYFEVTSVSSKRLFFNYSDLFPGEILPPYFIDCQLSSVPLNTMAGFSPLTEQINAGFKYHSINESPEMEEGPYYTVQPECGNCTVLGSNIVPDFWEE